MPEIQPARPAPVQRLEFRERDLHRLLRAVVVNAVHFVGLALAVGARIFVLSDAPAGFAKPVLVVPVAVGWLHPLMASVGDHGSTSRMSLSAAFLSSMYLESSG